MPTYAILGATGQIGGSVLSVLQKDPNAKIRTFVRSRDKLIKQNPSLADNKAVEIHEGQISDIPALARCIAPCSAVLSCIASSQNTPGCSIAIDTAHSVIAALATIRGSDANSTLPRIVVISSATVNEFWWRGRPRFAQYMVHSGMRHVYNDIENAQNFYKLNQSWMRATFVQPGGLVHDKQVGHEVSTDHEHTFLSFLDLAAGMIDVAAHDSDEWEWKAVSVVPKGETKFNYWAGWELTKGLTWTMFPWLYWVF